MLFKLSNLNSNLALTLVYLNPALNNSAQGFFPSPGDEAGSQGCAKETWRVSLGHLHGSSFHYYDQNPSSFAFLCKSGLLLARLAGSILKTYEWKAQKDAGRSSKMTS